MDRLGRVLLREGIMGSYHEFSVSHLPTGTYWLRLTSSETAQTISLSISR